MLRLWTFQSAGAFEELEKKGYLVGKKEFVAPEYIHAYDWLNEQMVRKVGPPPIQGQYPIWAWHKGGDVNNLGSGKHLPPGERGVRLEIEVDARQVVLSDYDRWHCGINYAYLANSEDEHDAFYNDLDAKGIDYRLLRPLPEPYHQAIQGSWQRVFDLDYFLDGWTASPEARQIQATFWRLNRDQVKSVTWFTEKSEGKA
jgi:Domain of unknown function (DUF3841)